MSQNKYISLKELADRLNMDRSHARRYLKRLGVKTQKRRTPHSGNQLCLTVTERQAEQIIEARKNEGFLNSNKSVVTEAGFFYVIQLVPELDPHRIKLGFAIDINERLSQHRIQRHRHQPLLNHGLANDYGKQQLWIASHLKVVGLS